MSQSNISPSTEVTPTLRWMIQRLSRTLAFGFGSGLSPIAPGTAGTLWAWAVFWVGEHFLSPKDIFWVIAVGILLGCWVCGQVSEELGKRDYGGIVWDEIMAFWLVLIFIAPSSFWMQLIAFELFRFFDATKPGPIGLIDRHFKQAGSDDAPSTPLQIFWRGFGIMVDDLAAAFLTLLCIALFQFLV